MTTSTQRLQAKAATLALDVTAGVLREIVRTALDHRRHVAQADDPRCLPDREPIRRQALALAGKEVRSRAAGITVGALLRAASQRHHDLTNR